MYHAGTVSLTTTLSSNKKAKLVLTGGQHNGNVEDGGEVGRPTARKTKPTMTGLTIAVFTSPSVEDGADQLTQKHEMWTTHPLERTLDRVTNRGVLSGVRSRGIAQAPLHGEHPVDVR